jgi:peptidoglycan-N-acetylglucosamine deacetylase
MVSLFAGLLFALLLGLAYFLAQPRWLLNLAARFKPGAIYAVTLPANVPWVVALTIDDGPSAATADILAVLARYDAKATFFNISGHLPGHEAVVAEAIAAHHELGNHLTADEPSIRLSPEAFEADLLAAEQVWQSYVSPASLGSSLRWLRPGMGFYSASMVATAQRHGYQLALGSVFPYDTHVPFSGFAIAFILSTIQPGDIIVLHDGESRGSTRKGRGQRTVDTLKKILPALQARGYTVTTLTNLSRAAESIG